MWTSTLIILVCTLVAVASASPKLKTIPNAGLNTGKIVGGVEADVHEFKFLVSLRWDRKCGGSIVDSEWVVTSAWCCGYRPLNFIVVAGDHNTDVVEGTEQTRAVVGAILHPKYKHGLMYENDIALLKISPPFEFNEYVQPVIIPGANFSPPASATIAGWGVKSIDGELSSLLMKADLSFLDDETCNKTYLELEPGYGGTARSMVCYGEAGKDWCAGDAGGPLVCGDDQTLCGIISDGGCTTSNLTYPGVFTETSYFGDWIRGNFIPIEEDSSPVETITTCGGRIDASSGEIIYQLGASIEADTKCVWIIKAPLRSVRIRLTSSGLGENDGIYISNFRHFNPQNQERIIAIDQNYTITSGFVLITLSVGDSPSQGFRLEFFSSGLINDSEDFKTFINLNTSSGNLSYPVGGGLYEKYERALFVVNPTVPAMKTVTFTRMDIAYYTYCWYVRVEVYIWMDNEYTLVSWMCGNSISQPTTLPTGVGLITFVSDYSAVRTGFDFEWD